jgi:hypothetical protein
MVDGSHIRAIFSIFPKNQYHNGNLNELIKI